MITKMVKIEDSQFDYIKQQAEIKKIPVNEYLEKLIFQMIEFKKRDHIEPKMIWRH